MSKISAPARFWRLIVAAMSAMLLSACWFSTPRDDDGTSACTGREATSCARYDLLGRLGAGCEMSYLDCNELCRDDGWARSAGCAWEPRVNEHRCVCTNDTSCECSAAAASCLDADTIVYCTNGCHWAGYDCDEVCRDAGYDHSTGCDVDAASGVDACFCADEPECECNSGDYACGSDFTILACDGCRWYEYDCHGVCAENGEGRSIGCGYDSYYGGDSCFCEGAPGVCQCTAGDYLCWDAYTIASCDDGCSWYLSDCADVCWSSGYHASTGCGYDAYYGETCLCTSY